MEFLRARPAGTGCEGNRVLAAAGSEVLAEMPQGDTVGRGPESHKPRFPSWLPSLTVLLGEIPLGPGNV